MKKNYWVLTALALFIVAVSFATDKPKMNIVTGENNNALVTFESLTAYPLEITICNTFGDIVYYWKGKSLQTSLNQSLNVADLGNGIYHVCLNYGGQSLNRDLTVTRNDVKVSPVTELYEPFFSYEKERLNLSFLNVAQKNVYLNVYQGEKHVTGVNLGNRMDIQKSIDFSNLDNGKYEVVVTEEFKDHHFLVTK